MCRAVSSDSVKAHTFHFGPTSSMSSSKFYRVGFQFWVYSRFAKKKKLYFPHLFTLNRSQGYLVNITVNLGISSKYVDKLFLLVHTRQREFANTILTAPLYCSTSTVTSLFFTCCPFCHGVFPRFF